MRPMGRKDDARRATPRGAEDPDAPARPKSSRPTWKASLVLYPFLFAMAPVLSVYADNVHQAYLSDLVRPLVGSAGITLLAVLISIPLARGLARAGLPSLIVVFFVFAYGPVVRLLPFQLRSRYFFPAWSALWLGAYVAALVYMRRTRRGLRRLTGALNWVGAAVALVPVVLCVPAWCSSEPTAATAHEAQPATRSVAATPPASDLPDIYFITADGYARADILRDRFGYDNSPFIEKLRSRGFYVADKSTSNYMHSHLSMACTLQLEYLDRHIRHLGDVGETNEGWHKASRYFFTLVQQSYVRRYLEARGYRTIRYGFAYDAVKSVATRRRRWTFLSEFELVVLGETVLGPLLKFWPSEPLSPHDLRRRRIKETFGEIPQIAQGPGPKFVSLHIVCPHRPFVFNADGADQPPAEPYDSILPFEDLKRTPGWDHWYRTRYPAQVQGLNIYIDKAIDDILGGSARPPIIVLQADHGPALGLDYDLRKSNPQERTAILNAILLPGKPTSQLYPEISSVNTFRVIFNQYFGENYPLLPDRNFHSGLGVRLTEVTERVRGSAHRP